MEEDTSSAESIGEEDRMETSTKKRVRIVPQPKPDATDSPPRKKAKTSAPHEDEPKEEITASTSGQAPPTKERLLEPSRVATRTDPATNSPPMERFASRFTTTDSNETSVKSIHHPNNISTSSIHPTKTETPVTSFPFSHHELLVSACDDCDGPHHGRRPDPPNDVAIPGDPASWEQEHAPTSKKHGLTTTTTNRRDALRAPPLQLASFASSDDSVMSSSPAVEKGTPDVHYDPKLKSSRLMTILSYAAAVWVGLFCYGKLLMPSSHYSEHCVAAQGGGYSGFYYMHGVLERNRDSILPDPTSPPDFVCYSAGCLSIVALWSRYTGQDVTDFGMESQHRVASGQMPWIQATERMVYNLIRGNRLRRRTRGNRTKEPPMQVLARKNPRFLASLHIMTTSFSDWGWPVVSVRTPTTLDELEEMLTQTCWLPFATGNGWMRRGHLDGAFMMPFHPTCPTTVGISNDWRIYSNMINVMMEPELPLAFFEDGLQVRLGQR